MPALVRVQYRGCTPTGSVTIRWSQSEDLESRRYPTGRDGGEIMERPLGAPQAAATRSTNTNLVLPKAAPEPGPQPVPLRTERESLPCRSLTALGPTSARSARLKTVVFVPVGDSGHLAFGEQLDRAVGAS